ncbi:SWIB-domain-containing protein [Acaromyces ingoldii]|uniref:SWIB-domain-containing protein n=1 Tax=Acaromyces ingoldii TaxID=215250 RepID=A0A316Z013_9BASI|nr:SWIB-domain-containing protein [Acaromyces ingoldii]PWN94374.1 SWIB-domain-containing protein [Acaromyces ingoldii]
MELPTGSSRAGPAPPAASSSSPTSSSSSSSLSAASLESLREPILRILRSSDLASISAKKVRTALEEREGALMRRIGFQPASKEHKSAVDGVTKRCFDVISADGGSSQASVKAEEGDVKPRSATSAGGGGGGGGGGGLALPGLGGVPGSHSTPSSSGTATGNGGGARLPPQPRPPSVGSSSAANGAKKKRRADDVVSSEEEDAESAAAAARRSKSSKSSGATAAGTAKKKKKKAKGADDGEKKAPNPNNPFNRPLRLSKELSQVCQGEVMPRFEVTKKLWQYIKGNELQNPENKRQILCDPTLKSLFGKSTVDSFEMSKLIGPHLTKIETKEE